MSLQRTLRWKSGGLSRTDASGFWQPPPTLDSADPQIPNLPLESAAAAPPSGPPAGSLALLGVGL